MIKKPKKKVREKDIFAGGRVIKRKLVIGDQHEFFKCQRVYGYGSFGTVILCWVDDTKEEPFSVMYESDFQERLQESKRLASELREEKMRKAA